MNDRLSHILRELREYYATENATYTSITEEKPIELPESDHLEKEIEKIVTEEVLVEDPVIIEIKGKITECMDVLKSLNEQIELLSQVKKNNEVL
jgi:hypothetical protein